VVSFNYRLLPYVDGEGLLSDVKDALAYIMDAGGLPRFMKQTVPSVKIDWSKIMVAGESAGGYLAAYTWLTSPVPLKAVYLRYPMLVQYQRQPRGYGGVPIPNEHYAKMAKDVMDELDRIKRAGEAMPTESSLRPPMNMPAANIFSSTDRWRDAFQHKDIIELLKEQEEKPASCPKVFLVHGEGDTACSISNSVAFKKEIDKRKWANGKVDLVAVPGMDHGFDYSFKLGAEGCEWLGELVPRIKRAWIG
jgi:acetyl esterase/lipase